MGADRPNSTAKFSGGTITTLVIGMLIGLLFDEAFLRSGYHPVSISVDPKLLKSAVGNDPELEAVLRLEELREDNAAQQKALGEARRQFEMLETRYHNLEQDFHAAINMERPQTADAPRLPLTPDCILAVRNARQRACPCDTSLCPVLYGGEFCDSPADDLPNCLKNWELPYVNPDGGDFHMWTLNQQTITNKNMRSLNLGKFDASEDVVVPLTKQVMENLPSKEVMDPNKYRSCAIVGSSDNLLRQFLGDEINDHDVVVRFNGATTKGFEKHVGRITNIRFVTNSWLGFREFPQETVIYLDPFSGDPLYGCDRVTECTNATASANKFVEELKLFRQLRVTQLHPKLARFLSQPYVSKDRKYYMLSSGFQVALLMSHICQQVDMYGFAGMEPRKYFDHETVQEQFMGAVAKWAQEVKDGVPVTYPFSEQGFRRRSLQNAGGDADLSLVPDEVKNADEELFWRISRRRLKSKKGKGKIRTASAEPAEIHVEEVPSFPWERDCQEEMVIKGLITVHGVHVELLASGKAPLAAENALNAVKKKNKG